jgi:hypothetical protein
MQQEKHQTAQRISDKVMPLGSIQQLTWLLQAALELYKITEYLH